MTERMVHCVKLGREAPGLEKPPFDDQLGEEIYQKISQEVWDAWKDNLMIKVINEYRLNLADAGQYGFLVEQMKAFLNLSGENAVEVENPDRGKA